VSQPQPYSPQHAFVADSATVPNFPGQSLDIEFQDVKTTTDQILANLALIQRDDGSLSLDVQRHLRMRQIESGLEGLT